MSARGCIQVGGSVWRQWFVSISLRAKFPSLLHRLHVHRQYTGPYRKCHSYPEAMIWAPGTVGNQIDI